MGALRRAFSLGFVAFVFACVSFCAPAFAAPGNQGSSATTGTVTLTSNPSGCEIGYVYFHDTAGAKTALEAGIQPLGNALLLQDFVTSSQDGYIILFVKPNDNSVVTELESGGAGDIYSVNGELPSDFGNISSYPYIVEFAQLAKKQGYTVVFGFHRVKTSVSDVQADVSASSQTPKITVAAEADTPDGVIPGTDIEFKVTVTPGKLEGIDESRLEIAEPVIKSITVNGTECEIPDLEPTGADDKYSAYTGAITYTATEADCLRDTVRMEVTAAVTYKFYLGDVSLKIVSTAEIESSDGVDCKIADRHSVSYVYAYDKQGSNVSNYKPCGSAPVDASTYLEGNEVAVLGFATGTRKLDVADCGWWEFQGWVDESTGKTYAAGDTFTMPANPVTLKGTWKFIKVTPSIVLDSYTYDGTSADTHVASKSSGFADDITEFVSYTWYKQVVDGYGVQWVEMDSVPVDVGVYRVVATWSINKEGTVSATKDFKITPVKAASVEIDDWEYDATDASTRVSGVSGYGSFATNKTFVYEVENEDGTWSAATETPKHVGSYRVRGSWTVGGETVESDWAGFKITPRIIKLTSDDATAPSSANPLSCEKIVSTVGETVGGDTYTVGNFAKATALGETSNTFDVTVTYATGRDGDYAFEKTPGTLTVTPLSVAYRYIYTSSEGKTVSITVPTDSTGYAYGQTATLKQPSKSSYIDVASSGVWTFGGWTLGGVGVSDTHVMTDSVTFTGTWTFSAATPSIQIESWTYDGSSATSHILSADNGYGVKGTPSHVYYEKQEDGTYAEIFNVPVHAGTYGVRGRWMVIDGSGWPKYVETAEIVDFKIDARPVTVQSDSASKPYDTTALSCPVASLADGYRMVGSDALSYSGFATLTDVGRIKNTFKATVSTGYESDYVINYDCGWLEVEAQPANKCVTYRFEYEAPSSVSDTSACGSVPIDATSYATYQTVSVVSVDSVRVEDEKNYGSWEFQGWTIDGKAVGDTFEMGTSDVELVGIWKFTYGQTYAVRFAWNLVSDGGQTIDESKLGSLPAMVESLKKGSSVEVSVPATTHVIDAVNDGWWEFSGWSVDSAPVEDRVTVGSSDLTVVGTWTFVKADTYVEVPDWTFDGTAASSRLVGDSGFPEGDCTGVTYTYQCKTRNAASSDPADAGTWRVVATYALADGSSVSVNDTFVVSPATVVFQSDSPTFEWDGQAHQGTVSHVSGETFGYPYSVVDLASQTEVGSRPNTFTIDFKGADDNFDVIYQFGTLTVSEPTVLPVDPTEPADPDATTYAPVYEYVYDAADAATSDYSILGEPPVSEESYATGQEFALLMPAEMHVVDVVNGGVWDFEGWTCDKAECDPVWTMGEEPPVFTGTWVFTRLTPVVNVANWTYDATDAASRIASDSGYGTAASEVTYIYERKLSDAARGDGWEEMDSAPVHAGTYRVTAYWTLPGGLEVSAQHEFCVTPAMLELTSGSLSKEYDGEALEHRFVSITGGTLYGNDAFSAHEFATITEPGVMDNTFAVDFGDAEGDYLVTKNYGTLEVTEPSPSQKPSDSEEEDPDGDASQSGGGAEDSSFVETEAPKQDSADKVVEAGADSNVGKSLVKAVNCELPSTGDGNVTWGAPVLAVFGACLVALSRRLAR
jgi:hypothetical protein